MSNKVFQEGRAAFRIHPDTLSNPYPVGSQDYNDFERGWVQELKQTESASVVGQRDRTFASMMPPPRFKTSFETTYVDEEAERKKAAQAYAKAKGG